MYYRPIRDNLAHRAPRAHDDASQSGQLGRTYVHSTTDNKLQGMYLCT